MIRAFRAEYFKIRRLSILSGGIAMVGFSILAAYFGITRIHSRPDALIEIFRLSQSDGLVILLQHAATLLLVISLIVMAASMGEEWSHGTIRNLLSVNPNRFRVFAGKYVALLVYLACSSALAIVLGGVIAWWLGPGNGITTSSWTSSAGWSALATFIGNLALCLVGWSLFGAAVGILLRSAAAAVGIALAYLLVVEGLVTLLLPDIGKWLIGQLLMVVLQGGTTSMQYGVALLWAGVYSAGFVIVIVLLLRGRDITA